MMIRSLLPFAFLFVGVITEDQFQFDISFFCNLRDRDFYNIQLSWWDWDRLNPDDLISQALLQARVGKHSFTMQGSQDGDQPLSDGYQPIGYIYHDCTNDKKTVSLILTLTTLCETGRPCHYHINKDLTNNWGQEEMAADNLAHNWEPFEGFP